MTTGTKTVGASYLPKGGYWYTKSWSGANGKFVSQSGKKEVFQVFSGYRPAVYVTHDKSRAFIQGKWRGTRVAREIPILKRVYTPVLRNAKPLILSQKWNNYTMTLITGNSRKSRSVPAVGDWALDMAYAYGQVAPATFSSNDQLQLIDKLCREVRGHDFQLGVAIAEGRQTTELIIGTAKRLAQAVRAVKRGQPLKALRSLGALPREKHLLWKPRDFYGPDDRRLKARISKKAQLHPELTPKDISAMWLELQYGWKPLLTDVYEASMAYAAIANQPRKRTLRVKHRTPVTRWNVHRTAGMDAWTVGHTYASRSIVFEQVEALSTARSLGLCDLASVALELTPLSFVAEWFIPIGTYLSALNCAPKLQGRFLQTTKTVRKGTLTGISTPPYYQYRDALSVATETKVERVNLASVAVPLPGFKDISKALSLPHLENALALLHQAFR